MKNLFIIFSILLIGCSAKEYTYSHNYDDYPNLDGYCYDRAVRQSKSQEYDPRSLAQTLTYERCVKQAQNDKL